MVQEGPSSTSYPSGSTPCGQSALRTFVQDRTEARVYNSINFDSIFVYQIEDGKMLIYKVPFQNQNSSTDFILIAADPQNRNFSGNIIHIEPTSDWQIRGSFSGDVTFQSLRKDTIETMHIVDGRRTNLFQDAKLALLVLPDNVMPEVIISYTIHSNGGISFDFWMNLLNWVGIGGGGSGPGGGLSGNYGGSTGIGVYGPTGGGGGGSISGDPHSGGGGSTPICSAIPAPIHVVGSGTFDDAHPFSNLDNPGLGSNISKVNNGVSIQNKAQTPPPPSSRIIGQSVRNPPNVEDLAYGSPSAYGDVAGVLPYILSSTDDENFFLMATLINSCTIFDGSLNDVGQMMMQQFRGRAGSPFENPTLNNRVSNSSQLIDYLKNFGKDLDDQLILAGDNINNVTALNLSYRPVFNGLYNKFHGLQILMNDIESAEVKLDNFQWLSSTQWSADVSVVIRDHFGLDKHGVLTYEHDHEGFAAWWYLQHGRGYRPFETVIKFQKTIIRTRP